MNRFYLGLLLVSFASAQSQKSSLTGLVTDPSNAAVPAASLHLTLTTTGAVRDAASNANGEYRLDLLDPGDYSIRVEAAGFKAYQDSRIHLEVAKTSQLNLRLEVGASTEQVTVTAAVSPLITASIAQGTVISQEKVVALPLNGRQFLQLALLAPGVNKGGLAVQQNALRQGETGGLSVAGTRTNDSAYLLDGVINTDPDYNALSYVPVVDSIAEFQVQVAQYSAEYGRASGGQINVLTQSGSNHWHGSAWEFLRNNRLDARPFNLTTSPDVPKFQRNQYGGAVGGAIWPNRVFFFFNYEGLKDREAAANLTSVAVPTALQRTGNFSEEISTTKIYDPTTPVVAGSRTAFDGNIIPPSRLNPLVLAALNALPLPNLPGGLYINSGEVLKQNNNNYSGRIDAVLTTRWNMFARYSGADEDASIPVPLPGRANLNTAIPRNVAAGFTQTIGSNKVNDIRLGYNRLNFLFGLPELTFQVNGQPTQIPNFILGQLNFGGAGPYNATGQGGIAQARDNTYQAYDTFAWQVGRQSIKFGGEVDLFQYVRFEYADPLGSLSFNSGYTNKTGAAPLAGDKSGDSIASALLGLTVNATRTLGPNRIDGRQKNFAAFVQDDVRLKPNLTFNLGVRWEVSPPLSDIRNQLSSLDFSQVPSPQAIFASGQQGKFSPTLFVCGKDGYPAGCANTNWHNFSPRAGFAWTLNSKTVVRAGGGIYFGTQDYNPLLRLAQTLPTTYAQTLTFNNYVPAFPNLNVFSTPLVGSQALQASAIDLHQGTPYSPQWSFNIQRTVAPQTVVEVGYLGTLGIKLEQNVQVNNSMPGPLVKRPYFGVILTPAAQAESAFPIVNNTVPISVINYFPHSAQSNYHALLIRGERKFYSGFSLLSSFTWSKAITNAPQFRNAGGISGNENSPPQNSFGLSSDRGLAYFNAKFRWVTSAVYDLPFKHNVALRGWQVSGILQVQTGFPFTVNYKGDPIGIGGAGGGILVRPNYALDSSGRNVNPNLPAGQRTTSEWFNTAAFVQPVYSFGNVGRNTISGPNLFNLDTTIARTFRPVERFYIQFRAEFFNFANHPNYNLIGRIINDPTFGTVQNQLPARQIQFAVKLGF